MTASEANQRFSQILRDVSEGDSFTVTSRGRPVARIVPADQDDQRVRFERLLEKVKQRPIRYSGPWTRDDLYE